MPLELHKKTEIDDVFFTCCAIHNHLHIYDGRDEWESGVNWGREDGQFEDDGEHWGLPSVTESIEGQFVKRPVRADEDFSKIGRFYFKDNANIALGGVDPSTPGLPDIQHLVALHTEKETAFLKLQEKLVQHYKLRLEQRSAFWLRSLSWSATHGHDA